MIKYFYKKLSLFLLMFFLFFGVFGINNVYAQSSQNNTTPTSKKSQTDLFVGETGLAEDVAVEDIVAEIINTVLGLLAIIFLILMIYSGYQWMTAGGNEEMVTKAKGRIKNAIIGLVIVILAYSITAFVFKNLGGDGGGKTPAPIIGGGPTS